MAIRVKAVATGFYGGVLHKPDSATECFTVEHESELAKWMQVIDKKPVEKTEEPKEEKQPSVKEVVAEIKDSDDIQLLNAYLQDSRAGVVKAATARLNELSEG